MTDTAEVQVKLTLDDAASKVADTIKGKFDSLGQVTSKIQREFLSVAKGALSTALGVSLAPGLQSIVASFKGMVDSAVDTQGRMRAVASYFVAGSDMAWSNAMDMSSKIDEQLYRSSIAIGQNIDDARRAFQSLAKASDGTNEGLSNAVTQTEKLLMFADVTGESVSNLADEWSMMERGVVRTRGNMFRMLFHTGIFGDNMREASTYWGKLTDEQRNKKMADAMGTITDRFAEAPQTMGSVLAGLKNIKQRLLDVVGMNIIGVLTSRFDRVLKSLEAKRPQLEALAAKFGQTLGNHIQRALDWAGKKLDYLEKNWDHVVASVEKSARAIMNAVQLIIDNRELILAAYGAKMVAPAVHAGAVAAPGMLKMVSGMAGVTVSATALKAGLAATAVAAVPVVAALAAIAGVGSAVWQGWELVKEGGVQGLKDQYKSFRYGDTAIDQEDTQARHRAIEEAIKSGMVEEASRLLREGQERVNLTKEKLEMQFGEDAESHWKSVGLTAEKEMLAGFQRGFADAGQIAYGEAITNQEEFLNVYNNAVDTGNEALANYVANFAAKNVLVGSELRKSADLVAGGFDAFIARLGEKTALLIDTIDVYSLPLEGEGVDGRGSTLNLNGGQTFNIKQEYREADPDRVALYFRRDLVRAATSRTRARVRTPFGA